MVVSPAILVRNICWGILRIFLQSIFLAQFTAASSCWPTYTLHSNEQSAGVVACSNCIFYLINGKLLQIPEFTQLSSFMRKTNANSPCVSVVVIDVCSIAPRAFSRRVILPVAKSSHSSPHCSKTHWRGVPSTSSHASNKCVSILPYATLLD